MTPAYDRAEALRTAMDYHEQTKHHFGRYARSLGYMDWATQPDPFRSYRGATTILLDEVPPVDEPSFDAIHEPLAISPNPPGRELLSQLLYDSLALSAWKEFRGNRWSLRCNPSSGNLHPTEGYLLCGPGSGIGDQAGIYHYSPLLHALERRAAFPAELWQELVRGLPEGVLLLGLSSIHWRESWKYGERAYRYCQLDAGHAIAAVSYAAAAQGWQMKLLEGVGDEELAVLLGIGGQQGPEREHPDALIAAAPGAARGLARAATSWRPHPNALGRLGGLELAGSPNSLSPDHHSWPAIDAVSEACWKSPEPLSEMPWSPTSRPLPSSLEPRSQGARTIMRQRRSAVDMDGRTQVDLSAFYRILSALLPAPDLPPLSSIPWRPAIDLVIFVHRVRGLEPGMYVLVRNQERQRQLEAVFRDDFVWERPQGCPDDVPLFLLLRGDARRVAEDVSCHQAIASHGAFALSMVSEFEPRLEQNGPWFYRRLFWEAGALGQVLYLEAEAAGVRATGIGCFFDDVVHEFLGLGEQERTYQVLYHLTVGGSVEDERLSTAPSYFHREQALAKAGLAAPEQPKP